MRSGGSCLNRSKAGGEQRLDRALADVRERGHARRPLGAPRDVEIDLDGALEVAGAELGELQAGALPLRRWAIPTWSRTQLAPATSSSCGSRSVISRSTNGSRKVAVPTCTARAPADEELHHVLRRLDAAGRDDRQRRLRERRVDQVDRLRLERRAGEAAVARAELGRPVRQSSAIASAVLLRVSPSAPPSCARERDLGDVGHVGRELGEQRKIDVLAHALHAVGRHRRTFREREARLDIGAAQVELDRLEVAGMGAVRGGELLADHGELEHALARHVDDQRRAAAAHARQRLRDQVVDALVRQPDRVQDPAGHLDDARRRIAAARVERHRLEDDRARLAQVDPLGHLVLVTEGAGRGEDGVLESETSDLRLERGQARGSPDARRRGAVRRAARIRRRRRSPSRPRGASSRASCQGRGRRPPRRSPSRRR